MAAPALSEAPAENELPYPHAPTAYEDLFEDDPGPYTDPQGDDDDNDDNDREDADHDAHDHDDADIDAYDAHDAHDAHDDNDNDVSEDTRELALERDRADGDDPAQDLADGAVAGPRVSGFVVLARKPRKFLFISIAKALFSLFLSSFFQGTDREPARASNYAKCVQTWTLAPERRTRLRINLALSFRRDVGRGMLISKISHIILSLHAPPHKYYKIYTSTLRSRGGPGSQSQTCALAWSEACELPVTDLTSS